MPRMVLPPLAPAALLAFAALACGEPTADRALCERAAAHASALELDHAAASALAGASEAERATLGPELRRTLAADGSVRAALAAEREAFVAHCPGRPEALVRCVLGAATREAYRACLAGAPGAGAAGADAAGASAPGP